MKTELNDLLIELTPEEKKQFENLPKYGPEDVIVKFSLSTVDKFLIKSTSETFRGICLGLYRPNQVEVLWIGLKYTKENNYVNYALYASVPNILAAGNSVDT